MKKLIVTAMAAVCALANAETRTWTGAGSDNLASTAANWSDATAPTTGDAVVVDGATEGVQKAMMWDLAGVKPSSWKQDGYTNVVTIATTYGETFPLFEVTGDVIISSGTWTQQKNPSGSNVETYRLNVKVGGDFLLEAGGTITVKNCGFAAAKGPSPGVASDRGGNYGGCTVAGKCYGSIKKPTNLGSGSNGQYNGNNSQGGGAFCLDVTGDAVLNGTVCADGGYCSGHASSAGGSVWVTAAHITGKGLITANGANSAKGWQAAGSGGRISLVQTASDAVRDAFTGQLRAIQKTSSSPEYGAPGTIYDEIPSDAGAGRLTVSNATTSVGGTPFTELSDKMEQDFAFSEVRLFNGARLLVNNTTFDIRTVKLTVDKAGGHLFNRGTLTMPDVYAWSNLNVHADTVGCGVFAAKKTIFDTGSTLTLYNAPFEVPGDLVVTNGGVITHANVSTQGDNNRIELSVAGNLHVASTGRIMAMGASKSTCTTGRNLAQGGSSHGGVGATKTAGDWSNVAKCYGSICNPVMYGSYGGGGHGDQGGGGFIKLTVGETLTVDGLVTASGWTNPYGGDSGGSVNITAKRLVGTGAWEDGWGGIWAQGAQAWHGDAISYCTGGGGRIAIALTGADSTLDGFTGHLSARGLGWTGVSSGYGLKSFFSNKGNPTRSGAGTIYIREKNAAVDAGTLVIDNDTTLATSYATAVTPINTTMSEDRTFGKIIVRKGGRLVVEDGITITTSAVENDSAVPGLVANQSTAIVKIVGDKDGNAYLKGNVDFTGLTVDSSVLNLYIDAGATVTVATAFTATGVSAESRMKIRSATPGALCYLNVDSSASTKLDCLDVKDCKSVGALLMAEHSVGDNSEGWNFATIDPGETITWTGDSSAGWGDAGNWDRNRAPIPTDLVVVPANCAVYPVMPAAGVTVSNLTVAAGASLTLNGFPLTVTGDATIAGSLVPTASEVISAGGNCSFAGGSFEPLASTVRLTGAGAATVDLAGRNFYRLTFARTGATTVTGGASAFETSVEAGADLAFEAGKTLKTTLLAVNGAAGGAVRLTSATPGSAWKLAVTGYAFLTDVSAFDSDASAGVKIFAGGTSSGANCVNWAFEDVRFYWTGAASDDFANAANWLAKGAVPAAGPGADDSVIVDAASVSRQPVVKTAQAINALSVVSGNLRVSAPMSVAGSVTVLGDATLTDDKPIAIGGDCSFLSGAKLTHTALPSTDKKSESYRCDITVGGDMTLQKGVFVDLRSKGFSSGKGPGAFSGSYVYGCHGGGCSRFEGGIAQLCYGSIFAPTNAGSGSSENGTIHNTPYVGGGAIVLNVAGKLMLDADIEARPYGYQSWFGGAGGSVCIRAGEMTGSGKITAQGGWSSSGRVGGGGRIALVLTKPGADFTGYVGSVTAYAGSAGVTSSDVDSLYTDSANGTIYTKTADAALGTIFFENQKSTSTAAFTDLGYDAASSDLKGASLKLGRNARVRIVSDVTVGDIESIDATAKLFLNGHTLKVNRFRKKEIHALIGTRIVLDGGKLEWKAPGLAVIVK